MKSSVFMLLLALSCFSVKSQVTYLDSSFNATGILTANPECGEDIVGAILIRPNGKNLVVGYSYFASKTPPETHKYISVVQFDINGKPDPTFGQEGVVVLDQLAVDVDGVNAALQPDGNLLILGRYSANGDNLIHFLVRLKEDGTLDTNFGQMGIASHLDTTLNVLVTDVVIPPDGSIVVGGFTEAAIPQMFLMKFHQDGLVDSSFGVNGVVLSDQMIGSYALAVSQEGWIYAGGATDSYIPVLMRFLPDGEPDVGFGTNGIVLFPESGVVEQSIVQPDGRIIVTGGANNFIFRLMPDGSYDPNFDDIDILNDSDLIGIALQADGSIIGGLLRDFFNLTTFRYWPSGQFDSDYGHTKELDFLVFGFSVLSDGKFLLTPWYPDEFGFIDLSLVRLTESLEMDLFYGQNGFAVQNIGTNYSEISSVLVDDQNRILFVGSTGYTQYDTDPPYVNSAGFVGRVQANGVRDSTFWQKGLKGLPNADVIMNLISRQSDGKIILAGSSSEYGNLIVVNRILQNGGFDPEFGEPFSPGFSYCELSNLGIIETQARAVAVGPDNDILVMCRVVDQNQLQKIAIIRFDSTGILDASFGFNGVVLSSGTIIPGDFELSAGLIQPDGKILLGGTYGAITNMFLLRFLPDGTLDNSFSSDGRVFKPFSGSFYHLNGLALAPDGGILLAGSQGILSNSNIIVGRLNPDGSQDITFNVDGLSVVNIGAVEYGSAVAVQGDGKIVAAGTSAGSVSAENNDPVFIRFLSDGNLDTSFAGTGYVVTNLPGDNAIKSIAVQANGNYLAAGYSNNDYLLIRYVSKLNVGLIEPSSAQVEMLVYPNPVKAFVTVSYTLQNPSNVSIALLDIQGKHRHSFLWQEKRQEGEQTEIINIPPTLSPGVYLLRIQTEYGSKTVRVLIAE
ncbi:MAG: T9SS type A sorting domain-containing protein [Saprospiraceae bacterium]|nr:T9SS type A sorting domain-containing protein [Saprospiraceae bacterium]